MNVRVQESTLLVPGPSECVREGCSTRAAAEGVSVPRWFLSLPVAAGGGPREVVGAGERRHSLHPANTWTATTGRRTSNDGHAHA